MMIPNHRSERVTAATVMLQSFVDIRARGRRALVVCAEDEYGVATTTVVIGALARINTHANTINQ